ncbi:MAG TPA: hypothetical protein IAA26_08500 [Candidatus Blautia faecipullorum]|nr:hypothetical protein [Candidatus Blautia faecipullorum]
MKKRINLHLFDDTVQGKIDRKYMAHFIDSGSLCNGEATGYERLGEDLEEYNVELNPDTEITPNILGDLSFKHNGYEVSSEADPYYARTDSVLSQKLQEIIDNRYKDDNCKTSALEVHLWEGTATAGYTAWKQDCYIIPTSYGGDTSGYQIPFTVNYVGERTKGLYKPDTKTFTPDSSQSGGGGS